MRIFTSTGFDLTSLNFNKYYIRFWSDSWKCVINLTDFITEYPIAKIKKVLNWIPEADRPEDVIKGFSRFFECLDYLVKTCNNERDKSLIKKLQKLNDYAMALQSHYNEGG
jgi:hypothetical protein